MLVKIMQLQMAQDKDESLEKGSRKLLYVVRQSGSSQLELDDKLIIFRTLPSSILCFKCF